MKTPELDKMLAAKEKSLVVSEFLDWLDVQCYKICCCDDDDNSNELYYIDETKEQLLANFFGIDLDKCEKEKQQILANLQKQNKED